MKKRTCLWLCVLLSLPVLLPAQFMTDYRPNGVTSVTSQINLISVTENVAGATGQSRAVNTIQEPGVAVVSRDAWHTALSNTGIMGIGLSRRYGRPNVDEQAAAIIRCPNGDFIIVGTVLFQNQSVWAFRINAAGNLVWSNRYFNASGRMNGFCIKKTNEVAENYVIAASIDNGNGSRLVAFQINGGGVLGWNFAYNLAQLGFTDVPKSMIVSGTNVIIAGNRASARDLFVIGINQAAGGISIPYRTIGSANINEQDPFINFGIGGASGDFVLTYRIDATFGGVTTGRIGFTRLNAALNLIGGASVFWETNNLNSFGHSIYRNAGGTAYDIGGGTTLPTGANNPLFLSVTGGGAAVAGSYRRLWTNFDFISTFMMQDAFLAANRYEHHNFKRVAGQISMSLLRNDALGAPCNVLPAINQAGIPQVQQNFGYTVSQILQQQLYDITINPVQGTTVNCPNNAGPAFRQSTVTAIEEERITSVGYRIYPNLVRGVTPVNIEFAAAETGGAVVKVYNLQSQLVLTQRYNLQKGVNRLQVQLPQSARAGTYVLELEAGSEFYRDKLVKEE
jgi:hypothetical protein